MRAPMKVAPAAIFRTLFTVFSLLVQLRLSKLLLS
jgi:hypothetical protein